MRTVLNLGWGWVVLAATAAVSPVEAATYYVCNCGVGADADCVAGSDLAAGTTPAEPWQTYERARAAFSSFSAGDGVHFCDGGSFAIDAGASSVWVNGNCTAASPCRISNYTPPSASGDEGRPKIRSAGPHGFELANGGNAVHQEGVSFANLDLACIGCSVSSGWGFFFYNDIDDVTIDNVRVDGFAIGVHVGGSNPCSSDPACDGSNDRIVLRNSTIVNNWSQGFLGSGDGLRLENNDFFTNGQQPVFDHNVYVAGATSGVRVVGNRLYQAATLGSGQCESTSMVVHGIHDDLVIAGNVVWEDVGSAAAQCWGITVDPAYSTAESFSNVTIAGNEVRNVGNVSIGVASCIGCTLENNVIVNEQGFGTIGIAAPVRGAGTGDAVMTDLVVRNNSISIGVGGTGIYVGGEGSRHEIVSNAIRHFGSDVFWSCLDTDLPASAYNAIDHNQCDFSSGEWARGAGDLTAWQQLGWGTNSLAIDPGFTNDRDLRPADPNAALVDAGHLTLSATGAIDGSIRDSRPDVGAYEVAAAVPDPGACPAAPLAGCEAPRARGGARLVLRNEANDRRDKLRWSWRPSAETPPTAFDPAASPEGYRLCVWDRAAAPTSLVASLRIEAGASWRTNARSHRLASRDRTRGVRRVAMRIAGNGRLGVTVAATRLEAGDPILPVTADPVLVAQWIADSGACWESTSSGANVNQRRPGNLRAKSD